MVHFFESIFQQIFYFESLLTDKKVEKKREG